jgi:cytochrome c5
VHSALKGKGNMPPQGGGDFDDVEIARAVAFMANAAGAKFAEPKPAAAAPVTAAASGAAVVPTAAAPAAAAAPAPAPAPAPATVVAAAAPAPAAAAAGGEALYKQACFACHATGAANAPKFGDKAAWAPRIKQGVPALVQSVLKGKGAMPPKGGTAASEAELRAAVEYMVGAAK